MKKFNKHFSSEIEWFNALELFLNKYQIKIKNKSLYLQAFTHKTYKNENSINYDYERFEFLGDAIIGYLVSIFLFNYPDNNYQEDKLTLYRSELVRGDTFNKVIKKNELNKFCLLGRGQEDSEDNNNIHADIFEALIAAIVIDNNLNFSVVNDFLNKVLFSNFNPNKFNIDPKSDFQIKIQKHRDLSFFYKETINEDKSYNSELYVRMPNWQGNNVLLFGTGSGKNKQIAQQNAAINALSKNENLFLHEIPEIKESKLNNKDKVKK